MEKPSSSSSTMAMVHIDTSDGVAKLYCPVCNKALISLQGYAKHVKKHEPPGGFLCRYCPSTFCSDDELKQHRNTEHTIIACRICKSATFTTESDYRDHIWLEHNGIDRQIYKCNKCGAEYKTLEPYERHLNTDCGTIKPHKCDECPMSFVTKYNLKHHKQTHTGERRFCCSYCGKDFLHKGRLVEHERSHTGEKPYKCDVCGKCFAHRESIVTHSSLHTGIRLVECKCCQSRFSCYSNLIKHRRARPETCGLPAYDPPKHRVRQHTSRIPATLNPTSEIRVCNVNKVIKPTDLEQMKKTAKKPNADEEVVVSTVKRRGRPKGATKGKTIGRKKRKKKASSDDEETSSNNEDQSSSAKVAGAAEVQANVKRQTRNARVNALSSSTSNNKNNSSSSCQMGNAIENAIEFGDGEIDDDCIVYDPHENSSDDSDYFADDDNKTLAINAAPQQRSNAIKREQTENMRMPGAALISYTTVVNGVKTEQELSNEKAKLIDCLLNDDDDDDADVVAGDILAKQREAILHETEIILVKEEEVIALPNADDLIVEEEDALADLKIDAEQLGCTVKLMDVRKQYPTLNTNESIHIKTTRKLKKRHRTIDANDAAPAPKCRKNAAIVDAEKAPKRVSKIKLDELKKRLSLLRHDAHTYSCPHCIKIYHMRKPFENHLRDDHKVSEDDIRSILKMKNVDVGNEEVFKCNICDKIYLIEKRLLAHMQLHGSEGNLIYKCPIYCNLYFASKEEATQHAHEAHRDTIYCKLCDRFMKRGLSLKSHMKSQHGDVKVERRQLPRNFVCEKCGKKFPGRTPLSDHVRSDCGRKPIYVCHICGKHLTTAGILKTHLLLHKDDTPFQCATCGKTFKVKAQYKSHLKIRHTEEKPFKCHLCPKAYPYRESLLTHMTVHTGIKRFLCNGCGKRFTCISNLQAHRKVQADTCGLLPLNAKATQYMGVQKGNLLLGAKPEAGVDYQDTNTLIAKEVIEHDLPMAQDINYPSEPSEPLPTVPLNYTPPEAKEPQIVDGDPQYTDDSTHSHGAYN